MSGIMKVILLLAVMAVMTKAQFDRSGSQCRCSSVRNFIKPKSNVKDIKMYPATTFCNKVEIVVSTSLGRQFCLNPNNTNAQMLIAKLMKQGAAAATTPSLQTTSAPASSTADSLGLF